MTSSDAGGSAVTFRIGTVTEGAVSFVRDGDAVEARYTVRPITGRGWLIQLAAMLAFSVAAAYGFGLGGLTAGLVLFAVYDLLLVAYVVLNWPLEHFRWRRRIGEALDSAVAVR